MKLEDQFARLRILGEGALVAYITLGDPSPEESATMAQALIDSGCVDVLELGVPFSDPIADGPVIQHAVDRALKAGMNTDLAFEIAARLDKKVPVVYLTYYNIVLQYGVKRFFHSCSRAGVAGVIIADLPFEEGADVRYASKANGVDYIHIVTPNTSTERMRTILSDASGFVYVVSAKGVTGARDRVADYVQDTVARAVDVAGNTAVAVGFGISRPDQVSEVLAMGAAGVIVGSAIVDLIGKNAGEDELIAYVRSLKHATRTIAPVRKNRQEGTKARRKGK